MAMTPKQKKFAALAKPRNKITYADKIAGATKGKAKRGKAKITKAKQGKTKLDALQKALGKNKLGSIEELRMSLGLTKQAIKNMMKGTEYDKAFGKVMDADLSAAMKKKQETANLKSKMKKAGLKTTPRRRGGVNAAVKKIKADKGKTVLGDRFKKLQQQTAMKIVKPKKTKGRGK
jgi:pyruvate/2-oxoglutarate dehydrogenase complex dihydrolipoamide acyltransferase (E2) component